MVQTAAAWTYIVDASADFADKPQTVAAGHVHLRQQHIPEEGLDGAADCTGEADNILAEVFVVAVNLAAFPSYAAVAQRSSAVVLVAVDPSGNVTR